MVCRYELWARTYGALGYGEFEMPIPQSAATPECEARPHTSNPVRFLLEFPEIFKLRLG